MTSKSCHTALCLPTLVCAVFISCFAASAPALAQDNTSGFLSGAYLRELCRRDVDGSESTTGGHTACQSYIAGVVDYHKLMKSLNVAPLIDFCVPNTEAMAKLQDIVWVYLEKNPQHSEFIAAPAVTLALYEYYPCDKPKRSTRRR